MTITEKKCTTCGETKALSEFHKSKTGTGGVSSTCKPCHRLKCKRYDKEHAESHRARSRKWNADNKERRDRRQYAYVTKKYREDPLFQAYIKGSQRIRSALKSTGRKEVNRESVEMLGCSSDQLKAYMGPRPSDDHGIDHICPISVAKTAEEVFKLHHYTNLRWLDSKTNRAKSNFWTPEGALLCLQLLGREWEQPTEEREDV